MVGKMRFLTFCKTYALCFRVVGAIFSFARICSPTDRRCAQMPFGVMGTIPQVAPSVRQIADFWHAESVSMRAVCTGIASLALGYALPGHSAPWLSCRRKNVTMLHVTCYNKHLPYVRTFFRKPEFGGCKKYIVYIIYILYILYIFYKPILRNMEPPYCNM